MLCLWPVLLSLVSLTTITIYTLLQTCCVDKRKSQSNRRRRRPQGKDDESEQLSKITEYKDSTMTPRMASPAAASPKQKPTTPKDKQKDKNKKSPKKQGGGDDDGPGPKMRRPRNIVESDQIEDTDALTKTGGKRLSSYGRTTANNKHKKTEQQPEYKDDSANVEKVTKIKEGAMADKQNPAYKTLGECSDLTDDDGTGAL